MILNINRSIEHKQKHIHTQTNNETVHLRFPSFISVISSYRHIVSFPTLALPHPLILYPSCPQADFFFLVEVVVELGGGADLTANSFISCSRCSFLISFLSFFLRFFSLSFSWSLSLSLLSLIVATVSCDAATKLSICDATWASSLSECSGECSTGWLCLELYAFSFWR